MNPLTTNKRIKTAIRALSAHAIQVERRRVWELSTVQIRVFEACIAGFLSSFRLIGWTVVRRDSSASAEEMGQRSQDCCRMRGGTPVNATKLRESPHAAFRSVRRP